MTCDRCHGLCVREWIADRVPRRARPWWWWRCINCGGRTDATILHNRAEQAAVQQWEQDSLARDTREWAVLFGRLESLHAGRSV